VLKPWETFYFMIGSAGAGLIGLLFVVVTLTAGFDQSQINRGAKFYMTPTAFHFAVVLTASAVAVAPGVPDMASAAMIAPWRWAGWRKRYDRASASARRRRQASRRHTGPISGCTACCQGRSMLGSASLASPLGWSWSGRRRCWAGCCWRFSSSTFATPGTW
jgi:hypothetical protein